MARSVDEEDVAVNLVTHRVAHALAEQPADPAVMVSDDDQVGARSSARLAASESS
jgi:hypothetical protein